MKLLLKAAISTLAICITTIGVLGNFQFSKNTTGQTVVTMNVGETAQANPWIRVGTEVLKRRQWVTVSESDMIKDLRYCSSDMHTAYAEKDNLSFEGFSHSINTGIRQLGPREYYFTRRR